MRVRISCCCPELWRSCFYGSQNWPLFVLQQLIDGVDVWVQQLKAPDLGGKWVGQQGLLLGPNATTLWGGAIFIMPCHIWEETQPGSCIDGREEARGLELDQWFIAKNFYKQSCWVKGCTAGPTTAFNTTGTYYMKEYVTERWERWRTGVVRSRGSWRCDSCEGWQRSCGWQGNRSLPREVEEMFVCFVGAKI